MISAPYSDHVQRWFAGGRQRLRDKRLQPAWPWPPTDSQVDGVAGNMMMLDAKIAGITPDMLSFSGRSEALVHVRAATTLAIGRS